MILRAVLGKNGFDFPKIFQKLWIFVQTRSKKSINSVFFWFVICVIKKLTLSGISYRYYSPFRNLCEKLTYPFRNFFLKM